MVRPASSIGGKWESAFQDAINDAVNAYTAEVPQLADKVLQAKAAAIAAFTASLNSAEYDQAVRAGLAPGKADVAYGQRLAQIGTTGFTDSQKEKLIEQTVLRRHLGSLIPGVIALATGAQGEVEFPDGLGSGTKRFIINSALISLIDGFSTQTSVQQAYDAIKSNVANFDDLSIAA